MNVTLVAWYGSTSAQVADLVAAAQEIVAGRLGESFIAYAPEQVHATIVGLEGVRDDSAGVVNRNHVELTGQRCPMDLARAAELLAELHEVQLPLRVQIGGFRPDRDYGFTSRGRHPHERSFTLRREAAVMVGWPVHDPTVPLRLDRIRRRFNGANILHKYHTGEAVVDNDLYLVLGRAKTELDERLLAQTRHDVRDYLADNPVTIDLTRDDVCIVSYTDPTLPPASSATVTLPIDPAGLAALYV